ncbi:hypothetical protein BDZ85DRAFT_253355 [Elsinoe ampelina]|uniref:Uncharacterized protein n=1 Tax=Elsinoe ampelina TaxID=302913 RepID=A0A6A6FZC3_9PEZI|nr:hypothetical protein BDZ85DRAFT_253355 [Elsinoe ampelina]
MADQDDVDGTHAGPVRIRAVITVDRINRIEEDMDEASQQRLSVWRKKAAFGSAMAFHTLYEPDLGVVLNNTLQFLDSLESSEWENAVCGKAFKVGTSTDDKRAGGVGSGFWPVEETDKYYSDVQADMASFMQQFKSDFADVKPGERPLWGSVLIKLAGVVLPTPSTLLYVQHNLKESLSPDKFANNLEKLVDTVKEYQWRSVHVKAGQVLSSGEAIQQLCHIYHILVTLQQDDLAADIKSAMLHVHFYEHYDRLCADFSANGYGTNESHMESREVGQQAADFPDTFIDHLLECLIPTTTKFAVSEMGKQREVARLNVDHFKSKGEKLCIWTREFGIGFTWFLLCANWEQSPHNVNQQDISLIAAMINKDDPSIRQLSTLIYNNLLAYLVEPNRAGKIVPKLRLSTLPKDKWHAVSLMVLASRDTINVIKGFPPRNDDVLEYPREHLIFENEAQLAIYNESFTDLDPRPMIPQYHKTTT